LRAEYEIIGFLDDVNPDRKNAIFCGSRILGGQEQLVPLREQGVDHIILGFGDCNARLKLSKLARELGFYLATAIHPRATVAADVSIGAGTVIVAGSVVNPGAHIGENVIINTCASIDHECIIEDGVHICPGVRLGARVRVGRAAWIGIGATIKDRVHIGPGSLIGVGAVVLSDIPGGVVAYGVPARIVREMPCK
jgi:acetyltransferase EpsM